MMKDVTDRSITYANNLEAKRVLRVTVPIMTIITPIRLGTNIYWLVLTLSWLCAQSFRLIFISFFLPTFTL